MIMMTVRKLSDSAVLDPLRFSTCEQELSSVLTAAVGDPKHNGVTNCEFAVHAP